MSEPDEERDPLEVLAAEFIARQRSGGFPSVSEYAAKYPELAAEIQELFPAIAAVERLKVHKEEASGARVSLGAPKLERLGDFRILGEIGRGGMGIVYEAFQESLGRHVAVKVLPRQSLLNPRQVQRFRRESQTAARLHHTNIVPVFGVGEHEGFHYIVMQLIRGVGLEAILASLQRICLSGPAQRSDEDGEPPCPQSASEAARLAGLLVEGHFWHSREFRLASLDSAETESPSGEREPEVALPRPSGVTAATEDFEGGRDTKANGDAEPTLEAPPPAPAPPAARRLGPAYWRSAAAIALQVAEAIHYAHAHDTLHRDIKPANLLLDSQGVVWVTDFGLAKAVEQENVTQTGGVVGTLRYMAPEQFSGQTDARSDIYSLGLTLYELVTLRPAFDDSDRSRLIRKIVHDEPVRPRKLDPGIPRDLETIVLKAIARDPAHRYRSAGELARDLQCFLDDRPIQARRVSLAERLWRWSRRNRALAALAASTLALLVLFAVVTSAGYVQTARANVEEAKQRKKAEDTSALALEALDKIFQQFAPDRIRSASTLTLVGDAGEEYTVPVQPVLSKEAAALLEHMLEFYDRLAAQSGQDAKLRRKVAEANRRVGDIRQRLGDYEESKAAYVRAIETYRRLAETSGEDAELRTDIARIQNELGNVYSAMGDPKAGRASYADALATLKADSSDASASPECRYELARTYYFLGRGPGPPGPPPRAFGGPPDAGGPPQPGGPRGPRGGFPGFAKGLPGKPELPPKPRWPEAGNAGPPDAPPDRVPGPHARSPGPPRRFPGFGPDLGQESLQKAIALLERLVSEHPAVPDYRHLLALCYREVFPRPFTRGLDPSADAADKATKILQALVEEYPDVPDYRHDLCKTYLMRELRRAFSSRVTDPPEHDMLDKALALSEELVAEHPNVPDYVLSQIHIRVALAGVLWMTDSTGAETHLRKALALQSSLVRRYPRNSPYKFGLTGIHDFWSWLLEQSDRLAEARSMVEASIASLEEALDNDPKAGFVRRLLADRYLRLAYLLGRMGEDQAADDALLQAKALRPRR